MSSDGEEDPKNGGDRGGEGDKVLLLYLSPLISDLPHLPNLSYLPQTDD